MATEGMDNSEVDELSGWAEALQEQKKAEEGGAEGEDCFVFLWG